jgi:hypothetical protein
LLLDALLERAIPRGKVGGLRPHLIVQLLEAQDRLHARHQCHLVDRLGQIFVGSRFQTGDHIRAGRLGGDEDDGHERQVCIGFEPPAHFHAVELRHHDVQQDEVWKVLHGGRERLLAVGGLEQFIALGRKPRHQNVAIHLVVIDDQNARGRVHVTARRGR